MRNVGSEERGPYDAEFTETGTQRARRKARNIGLKVGRNILPKKALLWIY